MQNPRGYLVWWFHVKIGLILSFDTIKGTKKFAVRLSRGWKSLNFKADVYNNTILPSKPFPPALIAHLTDLSTMSFLLPLPNAPPRQSQKPLQQNLPTQSYALSDFHRKEKHTEVN